MKHIPIFFIIMFFLFNSCSDEKKQKEKSKGKNKKNSSFEKIKSEFIDSLAVEKFISTHPEFKSYQKKIHKFYSKKKYELAWSKEGEFIPQVSMFINILNNIGLYEIKEQYRQTAEEKKISGKDVADLRKNLDLLLTASFFKYSKEIWKDASNPEQEKIDWYIGRKKEKYVTTLDVILAQTKSDDTLQANEPMHEEYNRLKILLATYRDLQYNGGWPIIRLEEGIRLQIGKESDQVSLLKKRLYLSGDLKIINYDSDFNSHLEAAVKNFQKRHGLKETGIVYGRTLDAMNVTVDQRIQQIIVNMERWHWVPERTSEDYVMVNIPEFKLHAYEYGNEVLAMNVIVGEAATGTPIFNDEIEYIVMSPTWHIPSNIAVKEIVPWQRKDPMFLEKNNMEVLKDSIMIDPLSIDWNTLTEDSIRQYKFRQRPGGYNSLGNIKFAFPNEYDIYLHDTPKSNLFNLSARAFSHGCIRIQEPVKFAEYLLKDDPEWPTERIREAIYSGQEQFVTLKKKIPVYIVYFTAWVDEQGLANFRQDIYHHDENLGAIYYEE